MAMVDVIFLFVILMIRFLKANQWDSFLGIGTHFEISKGKFLTHNEMMELFVVRVPLCGRCVICVSTLW